MAVRKTVLFLFLTLGIFFYLTGSVRAQAESVRQLAVDLQIPPGDRSSATYVAPNSTVTGLLIVESLSGPLSGCVYIDAVNCTLETPRAYNFTLRVAHDSRTYPVRVSVRDVTCVVTVTCVYDGGNLTVTKLLIPAMSWNVTVELIIPSDPFGNLDPRREKFTVVAKPSYTPAFIKFITGKEERGHPDLLTLACVTVRGPGTYTVVLVFERADGTLLPVSSTSLEMSEATELSYGVITVSGIKGGGKVVIPIFTPAYPESLVGRHRVTVLVYPFGSSVPVANATYPFTVISVGGEAALLAAFSGLLALPTFFFLVVQYLKKNEMKDVVLTSLFGCLTFAIVSIPGQVVQGLASFLGPFDWLITGLLYNTFLFMLYIIAIALCPKVGTLTMVMFARWIMYSLFFGQLSIISIFWLATSALFFEPLLYLAGVTKEGKLSAPRLLLALAPAALVDGYVDLMLYAALYRLYYANWYVVAYSVGGALYAVPGILAGFKMSPYFRGVAHE